LVTAEIIVVSDLEAGVPEPDQDVLDRETAQRWIARWEIQQQGYLPDREDRFTALIDAVEEAAGRPDPLVLDLGCGPGSLSVRLLDRMPAARVVAIDTDPVLLALGRAAYGQRDRLRFADVDLRSNGWTAALGLDRPADAAVSTTALHWLQPDALHLMYARLATVLRPGGLLLDGDHFQDDAAAVPTLARLGRVLIEREEQRRFPEGLPETWSGWWEAIKEDPALAAPLAERDQRRLTEDHHGSESVRLATHVDGLRAAGFAEIGTIWQRGENRILVGVLPA
jgi:SAM-dependent methyltransferase